jgi:hypothetical protein
MVDIPKDSKAHSGHDRFERPTTVAMTEEQVRRAGRYVEGLMGVWGWNRTDLAREAGVDPGTVADFLDGSRWPQAATRGKLELALKLDPGEIAREAEGLNDVRDPSQDGYVPRGRQRAPADDEAALAAKLEQRQRLDTEIADLVAKLHRKG